MRINGPIVHNVIRVHVSTAPHHMSSMELPASSVIQPGPIVRNATPAHASNVLHLKSPTAQIASFVINNGPTVTLAMASLASIAQCHTNSI